MQKVIQKQVKTKVANPSSADQPDQVLCLTGVTRLADFITFVRERTTGGVERELGELAGTWRKAACSFEALQATEAGIADSVKVLPLPRMLRTHVKKLTKLAHFQQTFSSVPVAFGMVELDKLVVYQQHIMSSSVLKMTQTLTPDMNHTAMADLCLPLTQTDAGFRMVSQDDGRFIFLSDNHDARFQGAQLVKPSDIKGLKINGYSQAVVALSVGFTTNVLNVVRYGSRMVLNNGYHRAFALRQMGVTHAPCLIQVCAHWEDLSLVGSREMMDNGPVYFSAARPPLLKDFADPGLTLAFPAKALRKEIRIKYDADSAQLAL
ncbi:MAG: hypothetical protein WBK51_08775 [Polaromonas sp.]